MEADELHEVIERLEHAEHERHGSIRSTVTVLILIVTVLTALTGLLAARANRHNAEAQRERAVHTVAAQQANQRFYAQFGQYLDLEAASEAAYRRYVIAHRISLEGFSDSDQLENEATEWNRANGVFQDTFNQINLAKAFAAGAIPEQEAFSDARAADAWIAKEDANIGVAGLFAVCLFLLGLALTVPGRGVKWGFVGIAVLLAVVGLSRVLVVNLSGVHHLPEKSLEAFKAGTFAEYNGDTKKAEEEYQKAVDADSSYSEAWLSLGGVQSSDQTDVKQLRKSVASYRKAIDLGQDGYVVHNNLGYTSLLLGDRKTAETEINIAHELRPEEPFILMSEAELSLVEGDEEKAREWRSEAVDVLTKFDTVFRNQFFAALRLQDRPALEKAGVPQERLDPFYDELRDIEASIDALHSKQPLALDGASLSDLTATYKSDRQAYEIVFNQNGLHVGDVTSIRVYDATTENYSQYSSTPRIDVATDAGDFTFTAHTPIDAGKQRIELYLNGNFQTSVEVDSPGDAGQ